ncbi:MAG: ParB/RepB/Spo0J family partition protein [Chloroflexi bacterium]|nr:ParB/RepB/Spo0J family partition protein [Chloroflexota bacterium]
MKPRGLGRGLESLIPTPEAAVREVPVDQLRPNPRQPRQVDDPAALEELADSIRRHGVLQPILVTAAEGAGYTIIAGERRWRAATRAGLAAVPVVVKEATPQQLLELALVENLQRADLNPLEAAAAYQQLVEEFGLTQEQVAQRVGRHRVSVANALRLLRLPDAVKTSLAAGEITEGHARALLGLPDPAAQAALATVVRERDLSVRQTEELVRQSLAPPPPKEISPPDEAADPTTRALEEQFRSALGTKVELKRGRRGGRLIIHFYSEEDLDGLFRLIVHEA